MDPSANRSCNDNYCLECEWCLQAVSYRFAVGRSASIVELFRLLPITQIIHRKNHGHGTFLIMYRNALGRRRRRLRLPLEPYAQILSPT